MPGQYRWSLDRVDEILQQISDSGVKSVLLLEFLLRKMQLEAVHGSRMELYSRPFDILKQPIHSFMSLQMSACANILHTGIAAFYAATM